MSDDVIHVPCPHCQHVSRTRREHIGKSAKCNECDKSFVISESHVENCKKCGEPMDRQRFSTCPHCGQDPDKPVEKRKTKPAVDWRVDNEPQKAAPIRMRPVSPIPRFRLSIGEDKYGRTTADGLAPRYWALGITASIVAALGGVVVLIALLFLGLAVKHMLDGTPQDLEVGLVSLLTSIGVAIAGVIVVALAHLIRAVRDIAINSFLTANNTSKD